jgi:hypothetical protein
MELTDKLIEKKGFKRVNNSMWRNGQLTLQNAWIYSGDTLSERLLNAKRGYKVCFDSKFISLVDTEHKLICSIMEYTLKEILIKVKLRLIDYNKEISCN